MSSGLEQSDTFERRIADITLKFFSGFYELNCLNIRPWRFADLRGATK